MGWFTNSGARKYEVVTDDLYDSTGLSDTNHFLFAVLKMILRCHQKKEAYLESCSPLVIKKKKIRRQLGNMSRWAVILTFFSGRNGVTNRNSTRSKCSSG